MSDNDPRFVDGAFPIKLNGQEFSACMLTERDYADISGYLQHKYIEQARAISRDAYRFAISSAPNIRWGTAEGFEIVGTNEGTMRLGWQMIRKRHPNVSFEEFMSHLPEEPGPKQDEALVQIVEAYNYLHRIEQGDAPTGAGKSS